MLIYGNFSSQISIIDHCSFTVERKSGLSRLMSYPVKSPHEIKMPGCSSEFAVCDHMISGFFLLLYQV